MGDEPSREDNPRARLFCRHKTFILADGTWSLLCKVGLHAYIDSNDAGFDMKQYAAAVSPERTRCESS